MTRFGFHFVDLGVYLLLTLFVGRACGLLSLFMLYRFVLFCFHCHVIQFQLGVDPSN